MVNGVPRIGKGSADNIVSPRIGGRFELNDATSFYASAGTGYLPALNRFKFPWLATQLDNPNLRPETSKTYEIGMNNRLGETALRTSLYWTDYRDKIVVGTDAATGKQQFQNIAVRRSSGVEISWQGRVQAVWFPYANFSYTRAEDQTKAGAPFVPAFLVSPRKLNFGVTYEAGGDWSATLNARAVSRSKFSSGQKIAGYLNADAKIMRRIPLGSGNWDAFLAVNNLTDKKYETYMTGMWSDGRTVTAGMSGKF